MTAKYVVFFALLALANAGLTKRDAPAANPLEELQKHATAFAKTVSEQFSTLMNSKNTQEVNKAVKDNSDALLQELSKFSSALQTALGDASGKAKEALETARTNVDKTIADLRKAHPEVEQQADKLRDQMQAAVQNTVQESQKLAKEVAANVDAANQKLAPQIKQAYDEFTKQAEALQKKLHEAATKQ